MFERAWLGVGASHQNEAPNNTFHLLSIAKAWTDISWIFFDFILTQCNGIVKSRCKEGEKYVFFCVLTVSFALKVLKAVFFSRSIYSHVPCYGDSPQVLWTMLSLFGLLYWAWMRWMSWAICRLYTFHHYFVKVTACKYILFDRISMWNHSFIQHKLYWLSKNIRKK